MNTRLFDLQSKSTAFILGLVFVFIVLIPIYLSTLQTIPNGAEHYYALDVGETQIVLNTWGTLHATGYPLYVIAGNILVAIFHWLGMSPAVAPGVVSLIWGMIALALIYALTYHLTGRVVLSAAMTILFGLTRTVWIHNNIAEIYSFGLMILALLLIVALWRGEIRYRIYWLAFIGGVGVFHHRAIIMLAPALIYAVWPEFAKLFVGTRYMTEGNPFGIVSLQKLCLCLFLGLLGFLPYFYLPLRANAGAAWVYGEPGTWVGFWDQFSGREANRFIGVPQTIEALLTNFNTVNTVLVTDLTLLGLLYGMGGLALGIYNRKHRRAAITLALSALAAYLFHVLYYTDILSALILPVLLSIAFGWLFLLDTLFSASYSPLHLVGRGWGWGFALLLAFIFSALLITQNLPFISSLTRDSTGLDTITLAQSAPSGSTLMLAWGPRYFAAGFAKDVSGKLPDIELVDHQADFKALIRQGELVTPDYTFYNQGISWWEERLETKVYLRAAAPYLVQIDTQPEILPGAAETMASIESHVDCVGTTHALSLHKPGQINLYVAWYTPDKPEQELSVFVHLLDQNGNVLAQADQSAPVYGWRPLTTWEKDEIVRDIYPLPYLPDAASVRFGLYRQQETGEFVNEVEYVVDVDC